MKFLAKFWKNHVVQDVPKEDAICEFDCRKTHCSEGDWETCARRLKESSTQSTDGQAEKFNLS